VNYLNLKAPGEFEVFDSGKYPNVVVASFNLPLIITTTLPTRGNPVSPTNIPWVLGPLYQAIHPMTCLKSRASSLYQ
jgi:hypothetical protein